MFGGSWGCRGRMFTRSVCFACELPHARVGNWHGVPDASSRRLAARGLEQGLRFANECLCNCLVWHGVSYCRLVGGS